MFKWLFGFIAGALILLFFIRFSYMHIAGEKEMEGFNVVLFIDDKMDALGVGEGSDVIDLGDDFALDFNCNYISDWDEATGFNAEWKSDKIIFGPSTVKTDELDVWTEKWRFPYGVTNVYYISTPKTMALFIGDRNNFNEVQDLAEGVPGIFKVQITESSNLDLRQNMALFGNLEKLIVVFFGKMTYTLDDFRNMMGGNYNIEVVEVNLDENTARIHSQQGVEETFYLGEEMLYGVLFSGSGYGCVKDAARERLRMITDIYVGKVDRLASKSNDASCVSILNEARKMLEAFNQQESKSVLYDYAEKIENQNRLLIKEKCPPIY